MKYTAQNFVQKEIQTSCKIGTIVMLFVVDLLRIEGWWGGVDMTMTSSPSIGSDLGAGMCADDVHLFSFRKGTKGIWKTRIRHEEG